MFHRKREQICISNLIGSENAAGIEYTPVGDRNIVWPKYVVGPIDLLGQTDYGLGSRQRLRIGRLREDARKTILRQRAGCPPVLLVSLPPFLGALEMHMIRLKQRQKDIHVK